MKLQARVHREQLQKKREAVARENSFSPQIGRPPRRAVHSSIGYRSGGGFMVCVCVFVLSPYVTVCSLFQCVYVLCLGACACSCV